jgi:predicted enzyme related to lactoylglutathione lyase
MSQKTFPTEESGTRAAWTLTGFQVNLYAEDVEAAIAFYITLGFEESYRYPPAGTPEHVEARNSGLTIGVSSIEAARTHHGFEASQDGASVEIVLWCNDSDAAYAQALAAGGTVLREPRDYQNGRLHVARVFDPLGNPLVLVQKRDSAS